ncbi:MAG: TetR/AcrR family transcriptional regulator, partial [Candidatus Cloacimonadaceae bacterium]|nr:TetR/AcrR family transcriptional regulator [Candidatus Cloacimonadaceae bacterium]
AAKVFMKKGLSDATMEEIAKMAELSKATLYLYFTNKEELFLAVLLIVLDKFAEVMAAGQKGIVSYHDRVRALGESYYRFFLMYPAFYKLLNIMEPADDFAYDKYELSKDIAMANANVWKVVCTPIMEGMEAGVFESILNPLEIGMMFWTSSTGIINLMGHVKDSPHHAMEICDLPEDVVINKIRNLNFTAMLSEIWESILERITKKEK